MTRFVRIVKGGYVNPEVAPVATGWNYWAVRVANPLSPLVVSSSSRKAHRYSGKGKTRCRATKRATKGIQLKRYDRLDRCVAQLHSDWSERMQRGRR